MKSGVSAVLSALAGGIAGAVVAGREKNKEIKKVQGYAEKHLALYQMMNQWVKVKQEGKCLASYFEKYGYKKIAVYGMSFAGETLLDELKNTDILAAYGIDKNAAAIYADVDIVLPEGHLDEVDAVVVTAVTFFDEIEEQLGKKLHCPIISLEDILYEV